MNQGLAQLSHQLGRWIDPAGHAKDDERRRQSAQLMRNCPTCFAEPGQRCQTRTGNIASKSHNHR